MATVGGVLNCVARKLEGGAITNGSYTGALGTVTYEGTLKADFDTSASSFINGEWKITEKGSSNYGGMGTWTATRSGP
jgi:hypothetical protein